MPFSLASNGVFILAVISNIYHIEWSLPLIIAVSDVLIWYIAPVNTTGIHWSDRELRSMERHQSRQNFNP